MKNGQEIIWDSGYGYEYGTFLEDSDYKMYNTYRIKFTTGCILEETLRSKDQIILRTKENEEIIKKKYPNHHIEQ